jgi:hypothetical protein
MIEQQRIRFVQIAMALAIVGAALALAGCSFEKVNVESTGGVFLVDQQGETWNITTAVEKYGMPPGRWEFGLGKGAIQPLLSPQMLAPGTPNYPSDSFSDRVIAFELDGDARAYQRFDLSRHEVADEKFGDTHVAVTY